METSFLPKGRADQATPNGPAQGRQTNGPGDGRLMGDLADPASWQEAVAAIVDDIYAPSMRRVADEKLKTIQRALPYWGTSSSPNRGDGQGYRSAAGYLSIDLGHAERAGFIVDAMVRALRR